MVAIFFLSTRNNIGWSLNRSLISKKTKNIFGIIYDFYMLKNIIFTCL